MAYNANLYNPYTWSQPSWVYNPQAITQQLVGSDFLEACSNVPYPMLMRILDEHMSAIRIVYEREYENVMAKIRQLR